MVYRLRLTSSGQLEQHMLQFVLRALNFYYTLSVYVYIQWENVSKLLTNNMYVRDNV